MASAVDPGENKTPGWLFFGSPLVTMMVGRKAFDAYSEKLGGRDGLWMLPVLLPLPVGGDTVCAPAGLTRIHPRRFLVLSLLGRLPGTSLNVLLASGACLHARRRRREEPATGP